MSVLATHQLCKAYGSRRGISDVSLSLSQGEVFGFLGPNGAGKSTTIRLLLGFLKPSSGRSTIFGHDCWAESPLIKQQVGYVAGDVRLYPWLTARRAFQIVGEIRGRNLRPAGEQLTERFRLEMDLPVRRMSRGNRQKLALILALVHQPELVILDEPTSGLDPLMQDTLAACLREMADNGQTVFFSSHTLSEVEALCDRVAIVRDGRIVQDESLTSLKSRAPRTVVLTFSSPEAADACDIPDFVELESGNGHLRQIKLIGSAVELTKWAVTQPITDISIGPPNLESLFRQYYHSSAESTEAEQ
ncbi:MAG: ABC transporter ATP-binding protein [Fuerstiella sp.]